MPTQRKPKATPAAILAWHFVGPNLRDGRPVPPDGETLTHKGAVIPCQSGLHASVRLIDALKYAPGCTLCRVSCAGTVKHEEDKLACSNRTILWRIDAEPVLRAFGRKCALDVAHLWDMPSLVREYLETGNEALRDAAWDAARDAAWGAARDAAWAAALDAAWATARDAAWDAAWATARVAAGATTWATARVAARAAAWDAARVAAGAAAWDAAWDAARDAQNAHLEAMVNAARAAATTSP